MLLEDKTGIKCDTCSSKLQFVFTYYSADFVKQALVQSIRQGNPESVKSLDWCKTCFEKFKQLAISNYRPTRLISCDWCGGGVDKLVYMTKIDQVNIEIMVDPKTGANTCNNHVNKNVLDMIACDGCYAKLQRGII